MCLGNTMHGEDDGAKDPALSAFAESQLCGQRK